MTIPTTGFLSNFSGLWQGYPSPNPAMPGLYTLAGAKGLYVGKADDLFRRVPQSQTERGLLDAVVYCLPLRPILTLSRSGRLEIMRKPEELLIRAMFTLAFVSRTPVILLNKQHAKFLSDCAWESRVPNDETSAVRIARTILKDIGLTYKLPSLQTIRRKRAMVDAAIKRQDWSFLRACYEQRQATLSQLDLNGIKRTPRRKVRLLPERRTQKLNPT